MPWSTKQLADLATVSLRTIRHYHDVGLLPEPERLPNGYKQYDVPHLATVLRIKRMSSLGLSLDQIAEVLENPGAGQDHLRTLLAELTDTIARLERVRTEVQRALETGTDPDITPEALTAMKALGRDDHARDLAILVTDLDLPDHLSNIFGAITQSPDEFAALNEAFAHLDPDTSVEENRRLAAKMIEAVIGFLTVRPELLTPVPMRPDGGSTEAVIEAMQTDMNPAQAQTLGHVTEGLEAHFHGPGDRAPRGSW